MKVLIGFLFIFIGFSRCKEEGETDKVEEVHDVVLEYEKDEGIVILTEKNFDLFLKDNPTTLVEFYAPWCGHCKSLAPEYSKAASRLSIPLAKVDATVEANLAARFDVRGYPTLKFWLNAKDPIDYDGDRDADGIVGWVNQKMDPNYKPPPEEVISLTKETFDDFVGSHPLVLVEFYAPWCGHCKQIAPQYEKAAKSLKKLEKNIKLVKVDATVEKSLAEEYQVSGFPTFKIMRYGKRFDYNGPRHADGIVDYMIEQEQPAAKILNTPEEIQKFMAVDDVTIVGFFETEVSDLFESFKNAADMIREEFDKIGYSLNPRAMKAFQAKPNDIIIFYPERFWSNYESKVKSYGKSEGSPEDLFKFFRDNCIPLVGEMTRANMAFRYSKRPLVVVYYEIDFSLAYRDGTQYWRNKVLKIANKYKDKGYLFAIANENEYSAELLSVGLGDSGLEQNVIVFGKDNKMYPMDPDKFDEDFEENFTNFMKKIASGKIKPFIKSATPPKADKGPVKTLVATTFEKIVMDEAKDVLIEFYAPWCGHCKAFEPKYKELASKLKQTEPNLVIAKMDVTANDTPENYTVEGFPTIYFAPSGKKSTPIKYTGNRDLDHLTDFMKEHAVASFRGKSEL